jgi:hypothetical protein
MLFILIKAKLNGFSQAKTFMHGLISGRKLYDAVFARPAVGRKGLPINKLFEGLFLRLLCPGTKIFLPGETKKYPQ